VSTEPVTPEPEPEPDNVPDEDHVEPPPDEP
jgi:hypothetical protein